MKAKSLLFLVVAAVFLGSCGKNPGTVAPPVQGGQTARLIVFGAEWCGECKADLPLLQNALRARLGPAMDRLKLELWVPTGKTPGTPPSEAGAEAYREFLKLEGKAFIDGDPTKKPPRWPKFRELFPGVTPALPAAAIYRENGEIYKKFAPGADTFHPADIVATVAEVLGN
jgi:hypothetical protein